ncbi:putative FAD/NAD(P)-binding domain superfamily [Dioscorea sansibarensis]
MEAIEDIVIVGAGLSGLATALGLHRKGVRSVGVGIIRSVESCRVCFHNLDKCQESFGCAWHRR